MRGDQMRRERYLIADNETRNADLVVAEFESHRAIGFQRAAAHAQRNRQFDGVLLTMKNIRACRRKRDRACIRR
jgi:hypothetical protein